MSKRDTTLESTIQAKVIDKIKQMLPGSIVLKNDANYIQGIPDLSVYWENKWAYLEVKANKDSPHRPNQDYYIDKANNMSFGSFISGDDYKTVLRKLWDYMNE